MVTHMVILRIRKDVPKAKIDAAFEAVGGMKKFIPGILSYAWGPYSSPEGLNKGFTHGFCMTFKTAADRDAYLPHPEHDKVKAKVLEILDGGIDGVVAFDFAG